MSDSDPTDELALLDRIADEFESNWYSGIRRELGRWLDRVDLSLRNDLLQHLLEVDVELRQKLGESVTAEDYSACGDHAMRLARSVLDTGRLELATAVTPPADHPTPVSSSGPQKTQIQPGMRIDNYEVIRRLGAGGMGEVYLARHHRFRDRLFAIKFLQLSLGSTAAQKRFDNEINVSGKLWHPNIVFATDAGSINDAPYLVMEYVDGHDLQQLVDQRGTFSVPDACELIRQAASGLQHAHEMGLTHRDIKPSNIMLSHQGEVKVLDMGLARFREQNQTVGLTQEGQFLGTPDYMAPEQWSESSNVATAADIYSLGCTLFTLLTGRPPYYSASTKSIVAKMTAHVNGEIPDVREDNPEVPHGLKEIIAQTLAKSPEERFETPADFAESLRPYAVGSDPRLAATESHAQPALANAASTPQADNQQSGSSAKKTAPGSRFSAHLSCGGIAISVVFSLMLMFYSVSWSIGYFQERGSEMDGASDSAGPEDWGADGRTSGDGDSNKKNSKGSDEESWKSVDPKKDLDSKNRSDAEKWE